MFIPAPFFPASSFSCSFLFSLSLPPPPPLLLPSSAQPYYLALAGLELREISVPASQHVFVTALALLGDSTCFIEYSLTCVCMFPCSLLRFCLLHMLCVLLRLLFTYLCFVSSVNLALDVNVVWFLCVYIFCLF